MQGLSLSRTPSWDIKRQTRQTNKQIKAEQELLLWGEWERKGKQRHISQVASYVKPSAAGMSSARGESRWGLLYMCVGVCGYACVLPQNPHPSVNLICLQGSVHGNTWATRQNTWKTYFSLPVDFFFSSHFWLSCKHFGKYFWVLIFDLNAQNHWWFLKETFQLVNCPETVIAEVDVKGMCAGDIYYLEIAGTKRRRCCRCCCRCGIVWQLLQLVLSLLLLLLQG